MVHLDVVNLINASGDCVSRVLQPSIVYVDVVKEFNIENKVALHGHMFKCVCVKVTKLGFGIIIERSDFGSNRRMIFSTMRCETSGQYKEHV